MYTALLFEKRRGKRMTLNKCKLHLRIEASSLFGVGGDAIHGIRLFIDGKFLFVAMAFSAGSCITPSS